VTLTEEGRRLIDVALEAGLGVQRQVISSAVSAEQTYALNNLLHALLSSIKRSTDAPRRISVHPSSR
jgi:hypothetical protein